MKITGLDLVCAITRRCHFFALAVGFVNPSSQLASFARHPQYRAHTHSELASNAADPGPIGAGRHDGRYLGRVAILEPPAAELDPIGLGPAQAGHDAFADHRAFELGEHAQHLEHGPSGRRRGVEALLMQEQVDALGVEFAEEVQKVDQRPTQAIDRRGRDHVDVAARNDL
jgi:hypothetical protein